MKNELYNNTMPGPASLKEVHLVQFSYGNMQILAATFGDREKPLEAEVLGYMYYTVRAVGLKGLQQPKGYLCMLAIRQANNFQDNPQALTVNYIMNNPPRTGNAILFSRTILQERCLDPNLKANDVFQDQKFVAVFLEKLQTSLPRRIPTFDFDNSLPTAQIETTVFNRMDSAEIENGVTQGSWPQIVIPDLVSITVTPRQAASRQKSALGKLLTVIWEFVRPGNDNNRPNGATM